MGSGAEGGSAASDGVAIATAHVPCWELAIDYIMGRFGMPAGRDGVARACGTFVLLTHRDSVRCPARISCNETQTPPGLCNENKGLAGAT